ncbi:hypothetical protein OPQ81_003230 [Rhizoctonia solani]|nr:hypothetical protein OPQ81_003230 [Rhizoctonia solani]
MPPLILKGVVTKAGVMNKTVTVTVTRMVEHPRTHKVIASSKKYLTHDPKNELKVDDECLIQNCPPTLSLRPLALPQRPPHRRIWACSLYFIKHDMRP